MPVLSVEDLDKIEKDLVSKFDEADKRTKTPDNVALMESIADSIDTVRKGRNGDFGDDGDGPGPLAASGRSSGRRATLGDANRASQERGGHDRSPATRSVGALTLTASASGQPIDSESDLHKRFADALNNRRGLPKDGYVSVAQASFSYPEERTLRTGDDYGSTKKIEAAVSMPSLVATGGICAPIGVAYDVFTIGTSDRPLRDGLPSFQADRGGIQFIAPPNLAATASGIGIWPASTDANPGGAVKPRVSLVCGSPVSVVVDAITERALVGNVMHQFQPEQMAALLNTLDVNFARTAELNLLQKISANSTAVSAAKLLGATRDLLATVDLSAAAYRYRNRIPRTVQLTALLPDWTKDLLRADLAREQANSDPLAVTDAQIQSYFTARGVDPIWLLDGLPANAVGVPYGLQGWLAQGNNAALADWPANVTFWLFAPGSFVFLDGGSLNVGVVRDSTLNSTNDLEVFQETFESIAFRGLASLQITSTVRPNGASAAPVSTSSY